MRKLVNFPNLILLIFILVGCSYFGNVKDVKINIGESSKFSEEEIQDGIKKVKKKFISFQGCTLQEIWYDEEEANKVVEDYLTAGKGLKNGVSKENILVLFSDFYTNDSAINEGFEPDTTYSDWNWILIRDDKKDKWKVDDWGY